jgi:hypothetical protein
LLTALVSKSGTRRTGIAVADVVRMLEELREEQRDDAL